MAQSANLGVGYSSMPGNIGSHGSNKGVTVRVGLDLASGNHLTWGLEFSLDFLNEFNRQYTTDCYQVGPCHFDTSEKDLALSFGSTLRIYPTTNRARFYGLLGLGFLKIRRHDVVIAVDDAGNTLDNFTSDYTFNGGEALQFHLGLGFDTDRDNLPFNFFLEGRNTLLFYSYSGGLSGSWNPTIVLGIRFGGKSD